MVNGRGKVTPGSRRAALDPCIPFAFLGGMALGLFVANELFSRRPRSPAANLAPPPAPEVQLARLRVVLSRGLVFLTGPAVDGKTFNLILPPAGARLIGHALLRAAGDAALSPERN